MKVLVFSPVASSLRSPIENAGDAFLEIEEPLSVEQLNAIGPDWVVSYGYRRIIAKPVLDLMLDRFINLHISLLPYNRGAHPNFWSYAEDTPAGVSIHLMDEGIDTGDILFQREMDLSLNETLATSYEKLTAAIERLFAQHWSALRRGDVPRYKQQSEGTYHKAKDIEPYMPLLDDGWATPVRKIAGIAAQPKPRPGIDCQ